MEISMKILVLNGSPKRESSDVMHVTRAFLDGMNEAASNSVELVHVVDEHIEYCRGCFTCKRNGGICVHADDMSELLEKILSSELLIFSFPLYCFGMPAPLKALIDRTLPLSSLAMRKAGERYEHVEQADFSHLKYLMICGCGLPNSRQNFEPAVEQFKLCFPKHHTVITVPESPLFGVPEAASVAEPRLALVRAAGRKYAAHGALSAELLAELSSPMIAEEVYAKMASGEENEQI